ncbi:hypothetical protein M199_gp067 [Halogranum tailed virus 1]|uniref:Uncharacterized protein n=1 Tax=Halogranum tailed virus 1 TaxID=1273749 RepID=R4T780_9CAUD|nr:hypothetical protein M199_gp067 [Halogranum tailed virus 1]AGM11599.1 hypothetical protein HGTV1_302 [Halogranum tailed virus 1]
MARGGLPYLSLRVVTTRRNTYYPIPRSKGMASKATSVVKRAGKYVAHSDEGEPIGDAGALNFHGERLALGDGSEIHFPEATVQVDKLMHARGVLFIE